jgi:hypothetical protein
VTGPLRRPTGVLVAAGAILTLSVAPAAGLALAAGEAPWAYPVAGTAAIFGSILGWQVARGRPWARGAALYLLLGLSVEAAGFAALNAFAFDEDMVSPEAIAVALAAGAASLTSAGLLVRHGAWFATEPVGAL